jgi:hypothetical protein
MVQVVVGTAVDSGYVLDGQAPEGCDVLYRMLLDFSLYGGCSVREQLGAMLRGIFPPPSAVGHLPASLTDSPARYVAYLTRPSRVFNGLKSSRRLVARLGQELFAK